MHQVRLGALSFLVAVLLAACGGGTPPVDPARELSGTAQNWDGGAATVQAVVTGDEGEIVGTIGASGALTADGSFALTLPTTVEGTLSPPRASTWFAKAASSTAPSPRTRGGKPSPS